MELTQEVTFYDVTLDLTPARVIEVAPIRPEPARASIVRVQEALKDLPQLDLPPQHYFAEGMYGRNLPIPADSVVVGKIHRHEHFVVLIKGSATINTDRGMERISAPHIWVSPPGAKRILYTHEDCEFFTVHLNLDNERDLDVIEGYVIEPERQLEGGIAAISEFKDELQEMYA